MTPSKPTPRAKQGTDAEYSKLRLSFWRWGRVLFILASVYVAVRLIGILGGFAAAVVSVLLFVVFGGVVAVVVSPLHRLLRRAMPNSVAATAALFLALIAVAGLAYLVGLQVVSQMHHLTAYLPRLDRPFEAVQQWLAARGIDISLGSIAGAAGVHLSSGAAGAALMTALGMTFGILVGTVVTLVTAFWLLVDGHDLRRAFAAVLPQRWRADAAFVIDAFTVVIGGYVRAQLLLAALVGLLAGAGSWILGVPYPLIVGVAAGVFELIPLAGPVVGAAVALFFALSVSGTLAVETLGLFLVIHAIEGYLVSPRIQGRFVRLHPLVALLALLIGVEAGGFLGAFFAVPAASLIAVVVRAHLPEWHAHESERAGGAPNAADSRRRRRLLAQYRLNAGKRLSRALGRIRVPFLRRHAAELVAVVALVALIVSVNPPKLLNVLARSEWRALAVMVPVVLLMYVTRGLAWWFALRRIGERVSIRRCLMVEFAGQVMIFLPMGDLARVAMLRGVRPDVGGGPITATIAFQELAFMTLLGLGVLPRIVTSPGVAALVLLMLVAHAAVFLVLSWEPAYTRARVLVERIRVLRRFDTQLRELRPAFMQLWDVRTAVPIFALQAIAAALSFLLFFLALQALGLDQVSFMSSTFVLSLSYLLAGLSLIPGGLGAFEGLLTILLLSNGVPAASGAAAAILYRGYNDVIMAAAGVPFALRMRELMRERRARSSRRSPGRAGSIEPAKHPTR